MNVFKTYHPIVNFVYFTAVICFSMIFMHPVCICISAVCAAVYSAVLSGKKEIKFRYMLPIYLASAIINPLFNHKGATIIAYFPSGNPLTVESVLYGLSASGMIIAVICWFSCFNKVITSDKFIYLFGRIIPALSLILSMTLRFIPKFKAQIKVVSDAQKGIGCGATEGNMLQKAKNGIKILSILITWCMENAVETADSMKSRGYGLPGRTAFSIYRFSKRDIAVLAYVTVLTVYVLISAALGNFSFVFFPYIKAAGASPFAACAMTAYFMLCVLPIILEAMEVYKWNVLKSKI